MTSSTTARQRWSGAVHIVRATLALLMLASCSGSESTGPVLVPASMVKRGGDTQTGTVGTSLPVTLVVRVLDASGTPVKSARVQWEASSGSGSFSPSVSLTNSQGDATTQWILGQVAGTARATAQVGGLTPIVFTATALPGTPAVVVSLPDAVGIGVGDTIRVRSTVRDQFGNDITGQQIVFSTPDAAVATVNSAGLVTALTTGTARVIATSGTRADTSMITVLDAAAASPCGATAVRLLTVGEVFNPTSSGNSTRVCLTAPIDATADFGMVLVSSANSFTTTISTDLFGVGINAPTSPNLLAPTVANELRLQLQLPTKFDDDLLIDRAAEVRRHLLEQRELAPLTEIAREKYRTPDGIAAAMQPKVARVGDLLRLNSNPLAACDNSETRVGRVAAVGTRSIIVVDTMNPVGGYTDTELASVAATFDTLIYPLDVDAFGAPTDISGYGKVILFYTRAVNVLTPANAGFIIGGFFFARDLYPKTARSGLPACGSSNEAEMFYLLAPDPNGTINSNPRSKDLVSRLNTGTLAHEFQHLINSSRRLYVNNGAAQSEETWLDEGLAHVAEELLYLRLAGYTSRQNINATDATGTTAKSTIFSNYQLQNFGRFYDYLRNPEANSPYAANDSLATRGATWSFLRYAAEREGAGNEAAFFKRLVNSTTTGLQNLTNAIPAGQLGDYLRDWSISLLADDYSAGVMANLQPQYTNPTWNFRSVFPTLRIGNQSINAYPLSTRSLFNNIPQRVNLPGGATSYIRFSVPAGKNGLVSLSSNGSALPGTARVGVVRLR